MGLRDKAKYHRGGLKNKAEYHRDKLGIKSSEKKNDKYSSDSNQKYTIKEPSNIKILNKVYQEGLRKKAQLFRETLLKDKNNKLNIINNSIL